MHEDIIHVLAERERLRISWTFTLSHKGRSLESQGPIHQWLTYGGSAVKRETQPSDKNLDKIKNKVFQQMFGAVIGSLYVPFFCLKLRLKDV
jgi:hypothetical protein